MEQSHPPYAAGAISIPRQLNRWLDINAQNGPLRRTQTYITLPSFTGNGESWNGCSDIVASFNFEGPNNFSLVGWSSVAPLLPNYTLCISYRVGGTCTRYIIWLASGSVLPQPTTYYNGQVIKKNFRLEVWNTSQGNAVQSTPVTFYTSVKGQLDYRYGLDTALVGNDGQVSNFACSYDTTLIPLPSAPNPVGLLTYTTGIVKSGSYVHTWTDNQSNVYTATGNIQEISTIPHLASLNSLARTTSAAGDIGIAILLSTTSSGFIIDTGSVKIQYDTSSGCLLSNGNYSTNTILNGHGYFLFIHGSTCYIYDLNSRLLGTISNCGGSTNSVVTIGDTATIGSATMSVLGILEDVNAYGYSIQNVYLATVNQLWAANYPPQSYLYTLPLTFPAGATSTTN